MVEGSGWSGMDRLLYKLRGSRDKIAVIMRRVIDAGMWVILGSVLIGCVPAQDAGAEFFEKNVS